MKKEKTIVVATGVFDIIHRGHLEYLKSSAKLGDSLTVIVARDKTVEERKGKPFNNEQIRLEMLRALRCVDNVILGNTEREKHLDTLKEIKPQILTLGHDQAPQEKELQTVLQKNLGHPIQVIRIHKQNGNYTKTQTIFKNICDKKRA